MQMVVKTRLLFRTLRATKTARRVALCFLAPRASGGILQTSASLKHVPVYLIQKKFVLFSLRSHNSLTYILHTPFFSLLFLPFCSTPPSLVISLLAPSTPFRKSGRVTAQIEACALLTFFSALHLRLNTYTPYDVNFVLQTPLPNAGLCILTALKIHFKEEG
jgi:hypothetical protein